MAPMGFLVDVQPFDFPEERRYYFVAERDGVVLGFLAAVPVYGRGGWFFEDFLRDPRHPTATAELLIDAGMRRAAEDGSGYVTLGLAPLAGRVPSWLAGVRALSAPLYDFAGLHAFKAKLGPDHWDPITSPGRAAVACGARSSTRWRRSRAAAWSASACRPSCADRC